jgi:hypothetical protein
MSKELRDEADRLIGQLGPPEDERERLLFRVISILNERLSKFEDSQTQADESWFPQG